MLNFIGLSKGLPAFPKALLPAQQAFYTVPAEKSDRFEKSPAQSETLEGKLKSTLVEENIIGRGKEATAYKAPAFPGSVLRAITDQNWQNKDLSKLKVVSIKHPTEILENPSLGVLTHAIVPEDHPFSKLPEISPADSEQANLFLVKNMKGRQREHSKHPNALYQEDAFRLRGLDKNGHFMNGAQDQQAIYMDFKDDFLPTRWDTFREKARKTLTARAFLNEAEKGTYQVPENRAAEFLGGEVPVYTAEQQKEFCKNISEFEKKYTAQIEAIAKMEPSAYEEIVSAWNSVHKNNYVPDFQHALNTFADTENHHFGLIDLQMNPHSRDFQHHAKTAGLQNFMNVLAGKEPKGFNPWEHVIHTEPYEQLGQHFETIADKLNDAIKKLGIDCEEVIPPGSFYPERRLQSLAKRL
jgi:hypothetical protein